MKSYYLSISLLLVFFHGYALSQPPSPTPLKHPQQKQEERQNDKGKGNYYHQGTKDSPIFIEQLERQSDKDEKATNTKYREQEATNNRLLMYFTCGLLLVAIFQLGFFYWQLKLIRQSLSATEIAAKAAELNARAAIGIELPIIRMHKIELISTEKLIDNTWEGFGIIETFPTKFSALRLLDFKNHGRTPAFPEKVSVGYMAVSKLPEEPIYTKTFTVNHASVIKPDSEFTTDIRWGFELTETQLASLMKDKIWLWIYGCLYYSDFLHNKREAHFCLRYANRHPGDSRPYFSFENDGNPPAKYTQNK
jgi:hypothetical protein